MFPQANLRIELITSPDNPALKEVRKLRSVAARARSSSFVAEGEDLLAMADQHGWEPLRRLCAAGSGLPGDEVEPDLLASVSALGSGTRALAIYERRFSAVPADGVVLHLHGLADPGNVGTCIRSAHALGAVAVTVGPGTADPFGPKAVRASMGSIFALPVAPCEDPLALRGHHISLATRGTDVPVGPVHGSAVVIVGAEREGLPDEIVEGSDSAWTIPIADGAESLNAATASAIALYLAIRISR